MSTQSVLSNNSEYQEIAEKWSSLLPNKDAEIISEIYHEDAETWHNYDRKNMSMEEISELVQVIFRSFENIGFTNIKRSITETGFVQQHDIVGTHVNGATLNVAACVVVTINDGKISRLEEYIDPAPVFSVLSPN